MRFIQQDTYLGDIQNPISRNLYAYAGDNPLMYTDPTGRSYDSSRGSNGGDEWKPTSAIANLVVAAGFLYDPGQDIIYSYMNPWQRLVGYCKFYDDITPKISFIINTEPIYINYDKKDWLIEFWKGQYALETGAEIGIYNRPEGVTYFRDAFMGKFFDAPDDKQACNVIHFKKEWCYPSPKSINTTLVIDRF